MKQPLSRRLARNFYHYLGRLCRRVGLQHGRLSSPLHHGKATQVVLAIQNPSVPCPAGKRVAHSLDGLNALFKQRLNRLLPLESNVFGQLEIDIVAGAIKDLHFTFSIRPHEVFFQELIFSYVCKPCGRFSPAAKVRPTRTTV